MPAEVRTFLLGIDRYVINPLIILVFAIAFLMFVWGIFQFINSETSDSGREEGKRKILWGLFGIFIMFSAKGLIFLILNSFGIPIPSGFPFG